MSRLVFPHAFQLFSRGLTDAAPGQVRKALDALRDVHPKPPSFGEHGTPVALRWCTLVALGFPRRPFQLFRRPANARNTPIASPVPIAGLGFVEWGRVNMFHVIFDAQPAAGTTLTIEALERGGKLLPGQRIVASANTRCRFRAPGVAALRVTGNGLITNVRGMRANEYANQGDWEPIEVVGLPFKRGEIGPPEYDPHPQGFVPPALEGEKAAHIRLTLASLLHQPLPPTGIAGITAPDWPAPDVDRYLQFVRAAGGSPLGMIEECLRSSDDNNPDKLQAAFLFKQQGEGIRQADFPGAQPGAEPTNFEIPVVGVTMLAVGAEPYAATALGYGTLDFPPLRQTEQPDALEPAVSSRTAFDYMVTAVIEFLGIKIEIAALAQGRPDPEPATDLAAASLRRHRPPAVDQPETESVQLSWRHALLAQGYAIAARREGADAVLLNSARSFSPGFELFTPPRGDNVNGGPPEEDVVFTDPVSEVPLSGTRETRYLVIGGDVFGRWSAWTQRAYVAPAPPIQVPGLQSVDAAFDAATAVGRKVTGAATIDFAWDWTDRTARQIEFHGRFFSPGATPPAFAAGFQIDSTAGAGGPVIVSFDAARNPSISSGHAGSVVVLTPVPPDETRRYRLTVEQFKADFSAQAQKDFAVWARAEENVRPGQLSGVAGPRTRKIFDPLPPDVPVLIADVQWTALPDAANRARGVLTWAADPHALGYVVWEASEAALRNAIDPDLAPPTPETPVTARATQLLNLLADPADPDSGARSLKAFARLNRDPLPQSRVEVELPGAASALYCYRVSSVSAANQESARSSSVAWFAVPRRVKPGQPDLRVRALKPSPEQPNAALEVTVIGAPGPVPAGYSVFRVRNSALLLEAGMKGPPKIAAAASGWQDLVIEGNPARRIVDAVGESWQPYYYQAVALGQENLAAGEYAGESAPTPTVIAFLPPAGPPAYTLISATDLADRRLIQFRTNLPVKPTTLGTATIEVVEYARVPADGPLQRLPRLTVTAHEVPIAPPIVPGADPPLLMLIRSPNTPDGFTEFQLQLPASITRAMLVLRDPFLRVTENAL